MTVMSGTTALLVAVVVTARSGMLFDGVALRPLGGLICCGALVAATGVGHFAFRRLGFHHRPLTVPLVAVSLIATFAVAWGVNTASAQIWKHPWTRYADELGSRDACLADTPYGDRSAMLITSPGDDLTMEVWPGPVEDSQTATPKTPLRLRADGKRALAPADEESDRILRSHGCR
ncbi:hypothetical protein KQH21_11790 [Streptomyces sp. IpFD-1.1]|uniref:hypothetical protein n=1 Tax=unclassified Streptomyces TaxID=2593676 RepID=UPI0019D0CB37|nr:MULTISPECIES: hypothetical protein [unclassified Streptomyces]MBV7255057.1 hypothetical protein [Streptomyces sp. S-2]MCO6748844.1 hypothetical protein [Streptomyces sp. IpFD-1.1]